MTRPTPFPRTHYVYVHISAEGEALYVGCTKDPAERWAAHSASAPWIGDVADVAQIGPFMRSTALGIEKEFIEALQPPANVFYTERDPRVRRNWPIVVPDPMPGKIQTTGITHYASGFGPNKIRSWCGLLTAKPDATFASDDPATCAACGRAAGLVMRQRKVAAS